MKTLDERTHKLEVSTPELTMLTVAITTMSCVAALDMDAAFANVQMLYKQAEDEGWNLDEIGNPLKAQLKKLLVASNKRIRFDEQTTSDTRLA